MLDRPKRQRHRFRSRALARNLGPSYAQRIETIKSRSDSSEDDSIVIIKSAIRYKFIGIAITLGRRSVTTPDLNPWTNGGSFALDELANEASSTTTNPDMDLHRPIPVF